jgi:hypothetical protein
MQLIPSPSDQIPEVRSSVLGIVFLQKTSSGLCYENIDVVWLKTTRFGFLGQWHCQNPSPRCRSCLRLSNSRRPITLPNPNLQCGLYRWGSNSCLYPPPRSLPSPLQQLLQGRQKVTSKPMLRASNTHNFWYCPPILVQPAPPQVNLILEAGIHHRSNADTPREEGRGTRGHGWRHCKRHILLP